MREWMTVTEVIALRVVTSGGVDEGAVEIQRMDGRSYGRWSIGFVKVHEREMQM